MHQYQTDESVKTNFLVTAVLVSIVLAYLYSATIQYLQIQIPWYLESPSILGFFGLIYWLYNKYLWKTKVIQKVDGLRIPDIAGKWNVIIKTSHDGFVKNISGKAIIRQTAFRISIAVETDTSQSNSTNAALMRTDRVSEYELTYNYINHPKSDALAAMSIHLGTTCVCIADDNQKMDGDYYTGRDRENFGRIIFTRS